MEFKNIRTASKKEFDKYTREELARVQALPCISENYYYNAMLTAKQKEKTEEEQKAIAIAKIEKKRAKEWEAITEKITAIEAAPDLLGIDLSIEWKSNRTWGANPRATARVHTAAGWEYYESGSIGGCGYDKGSTAAANALNQSTSILKELYKVYNKALTHDKAATPHKVLTYGSGYGCRPYFEGGVGVSCYRGIFEAIGFDFQSVANGKMFDAYSVDKKSKK